MKKLAFHILSFLILNTYSISSAAEPIASASTPPPNNLWTYVSLEDTPFQNLYAGANGYFTFQGPKTGLTQPPAIFVFNVNLPPQWTATKNTKSWQKLLTLLGDQKGKTLLKNYLIKIKGTQELAYRFDYVYMGQPQVAFKTAGLLRVKGKQAKIYIYDRSGLDFSKHYGLVQSFYEQTSVKDIAEQKNPRSPLISSNPTSQTLSP